MRIDYGQLQEQGLVMQPSRSVSIRDDATMDGSVLYACDTDNERVLPKMFSSHPDDRRMIMSAMQVTRGEANITWCQASYLGITQDPTPKIVSFPGSSGTESIETHPNFKEFAGTASAPLNGAYWEPVLDADGNQEVNDDGSNKARFVGFVDPGFPEWIGLSQWITPAPMVQLTYWSFSKPSVRKEGKIVSWPTSYARKPANVKDALMVGIPYRRVGVLYQITEVYKGSGELGWNEDVYK